MMHQKHQIGIVGAGRIAPDHAGAIARHPKAELYAVADPDRGAAERLAAQYGAHLVAADLVELLDEGGLDGVIICSPTQFHAEQAIRALGVGVPVLVDKPFAADRESALRVIAAGQQAGRAVMGAQVVRFLPMFTQARKLVSAGVLGRPVQAVERRLVLRTENYPWWRDLGGFLVSHWGSHSLDAITQLSGDAIASVVCDGQSAMSDHGVIDDFSLIARYRNGFRFTSTMSFASRAHLHDIVLIGEEATMEFDCYRRLLVNGEVRVATTESEMMLAGFDAQLAEFVLSIEGRGTGVAAGSTVVHVLAALDAAKESARTWAPVPVAETDPSGSDTIQSQQTDAT